MSRTALQPGRQRLQTPSLCWTVFPPIRFATTHGMKQVRGGAQKVTTTTKQGESHPGVGKESACVFIMSHQHATAASVVSPWHANALDGALVVPDQHAHTHALPGLQHQKIPCTLLAVSPQTHGLTTKMSQEAEHGTLCQGAVPALLTRLNAAFAF